MLLLLLFCFSLLAQAQETVVTGTIIDRETNRPVEGATVKVKNNTTVTKTDADGKFTIKVPSPESIITVSSVGYMVYEIKAGTSALNISLSQMNAKMDEVVVVGYGTRKRVDVQGSVATIKAAEIEDLPVANLPSALVNRVPGVSVNFSSGKPGSTTSINIRNSRSFSTSIAGVTDQPLIVIDGIVANPLQWSQSPNADWFENLDASQIEDITFLKDASAAIYGAAGAKGVVLITTKKGRPGKPKLNYSGYYGVSGEAVKTKTLTAYEHAKFLNTGFEINSRPLTERFSQADLDSLKTIPDQNWFDYFWKNGKVQRHNLNISGGSDRITFFAGGSYYNEKGNYGIGEVDKYSFRMGTNATIIEGLTANVSFATDYNREQSNNWKNTASETDDATIRALYLTPKWVPVEIDGKPVSFGGNAAPNNSTTNRWSLLGLHRSGMYRDGKSRGMAINASLQWKPSFLKGLSATLQFGNNTRTSDATGYYPIYTAYDFAPRGQNGLLYSTTVNAVRRVTDRADNMEKGTTTNDNHQLIGTLQYAKKAGQHDFSVMVGFDQSKAESSNILLSRSGQIVQGIDEFWAFSNDPTTLGSIQDAIRNPQVLLTAKRSFINRANYSYAGKYFLEFIGRADASVNFNPENRWAYFPSVGLGWRISEEKFFRPISLINSLKLRANYGLVGEDRAGNRLYEYRFTQATGIVFGGGNTGGLDPSIYPNPALSWEKALNLNVGMDAALLNNKINLTVDVYRRYTYDMYDNLPASDFPPFTGITPPVVNNGKILSWGSEFSVGYRTTFGKDWGFNADVNFGWNNSQVLNYYYNQTWLDDFGGEDLLSIQQGRDPRKYNSTNFGYIATGIIRTQQDLDAILAKNPNYTIDGKRPEIGFMNYKDVNGDGLINGGDVTTMYDKTTPAFSSGITLTGTYKTFRLQMNMNLVIGGKRSFDSEARKAPTTTQSAPAFWADHWSLDNPNGKYPRADAPLITQNSTFWIVDGTQSRINNAVLSYQVPKSLSQRLKIPDLRAMITATNLLNIVNPFSYKDPYNSNFAAYPTLRTISFGLNASL